MSVALRPASSLSATELAALFNAAYEGYLVPFHVDEAAVAFMADAFDLDPAASRVAFRDGDPVGLANLGIRGEDGWIGGIGVVSSARRSGVGEALMRALHEQARERGLRRVWLEVIVENTGAFALYEKLGYRTVRDVVVWSLPQADGDASAEEVSVADAKARMPAQREPWQRADETLAHSSDLRGLSTKTGTAVFRENAGNVSLLQIAGEPEPLVRALRAMGTVSVLNLPADDPATPVFEALGATVDIRQHEMLLEP